jgi:hypothetical protein
MKAPAKSSASKTRRRTAEPAATYRGIVIQPTPGPTRFTREQLKNAVEKAIAKNADFLAGGTKT